MITLPIPAKGSLLTRAIRCAERFFIDPAAETGYWSHQKWETWDVRIACPQDFLDAYGIEADQLEPERLYTVKVKLEVNNETESYEVVDSTFEKEEEQSN